VGFQSFKDINPSLTPVCTFQAASAGVNLGEMASLQRQADMLQEEVRKSEARLRNMLAQGHPL
jgi:hypothetical protein